jgi:hypothetical protein
MERFRLRYVNAVDLDNSPTHFETVVVEGADGQKLGHINGFVLDLPTARPYYVVVDAGGWFKSKYFLVPIGHARLDTSRNRLVTDLERERVERYPGFDREEFESLSEEELKRLDEQVVTACCPGEKLAPMASGSRYDQWAHYRRPDWWQNDYYRPDRAGAVGVTAAGQSKTRRDP